MARKSMIVEFHCKPGHVQDFVEHARKHAKRCLDNEPGCLWFDVCVRDDGEPTVYLYETYADEDAVKVHSQQPYMKDFIDGWKPFCFDRDRVDVTVVDND